MGMEADLIAIGKFRKEVAPLLDYPIDFYIDTIEGSEVITSLFRCNTSTQSRELAFSLGIDPWDFNKHKIDMSKVDFNKLSLMEGTEFNPKNEAIQFQLLHEAGFVFYFRPNG